MVKRRKPEQEEEQEEQEEEAENANSILRDGQSMRVPLYMRDGAINPDLTPTQRAKALAHQQTEDALARRFGLNDARQLHRPGFRYNMDRAALERSRQAYADADAEACNAWKGNAANPNKGVPDNQRKDVQVMDAKAQAYADYDREMANAWRGPNNR